MYLSSQNPDHYYSDNSGLEIAVFIKPHSFLTAIATQQNFFDHLDDLVTDSFGCNLGTGEDGSKANFLEGNLTVIFTVNNVVAGFASYKTSDSTSLFKNTTQISSPLFLHAIVIKEKFKGTGIVKKVLLFLAKATGNNKFACTTQNPIMYCTIKNIYRYIFPDIKGKRTGTFIPHYDGWLGDFFKERDGRLETGVIPSLYDKCLYPTIPLSKDIEVNEWFLQNLNIVKGKTTSGILIIADQNHTVYTSGSRFGG